MNKKFVIASFLFLIGTLHTMVFAFIQFPGTFIAADLSEDPIIYKFILYFFTVGVSCFHQPISKRIGLKNLLITGLFGNILGMLFLFFHHFYEHPHSQYLLYASMVCFGASMLSVINTLVTYVILEFPSKTVAAITALFAFLNLGIMFAPLLLNASELWHLSWSILFAVMCVFALAILAVKRFFFEPPYPKEYEPLRSGSLLWREMVHRLSLYILAIFLYSLTESTFSLWGANLLLFHFPRALAEVAGSVFWFFMILGQLILMIPLYFFDPRKIFYGLIPLILFALIYTPEQTGFYHIIFGLAVGGFACAVIYPIVLALLEMEIIHKSLMSHHEHYLPFIDTAVSFLMAAYLLGSSVVDLWVTLMPTRVVQPYFHIAIIFVMTITILMYYLNRTRTIATHLYPT